METLLVTFVGSAIGGASAQVAKMACESGTKWLSLKFRDHAPEAQRKATENANSMLHRLAEKVWRLEQESELNKSMLEQSLADPQFGILLQNAIVGAAQTASPEKHEVLAALLAERLRVEPESFFSVVSNVAVETVRSCTPQQLRALALHAALTAIVPSVCHQQFDSDAARSAAIAGWLEARLSPIGDISPSQRDIRHLRAVGCLHTKGNRLQLRSIIFRLLNTRTPPPRVGVQFEGAIDEFFGSHTGMLERIWNNSHPLSGEGLTPLGEMIGIITSDHLANANSTDFASWEEG